MQVTVKLKPETARTLRSAVARQAWVEELKAASGLSVTLAAMHDTDQEPLASYFQVNVPDRKTAEQVVRSLNGRKDVMGAYITPKAELA